MSNQTLVGTWQLVSFTYRDAEGRTTYPIGEAPVGFLTYTAGGHMTVQMGHAVRPSLTTEDWENAPDAEIAAAARGYFAYCGPYELRAGEVVHRVAYCLMPNWMGGEQVRAVTLVGDTLTLSTPPGPFGGGRQTAAAVWRRMKD
jgi:hypothetical protein